MIRVLIRFSFLLSVAALVLAIAGPAEATTADSGLSALYHGQRIDPKEASHYFCHTRDYPIVRCFDSQAQVDADLGWIEPKSPLDPGSFAPALTTSAASPDFTGPYTIAYWDINYGGNALTLYGAVANLDSLGWNDAISSIKSVNCGIPRYWTDANYAGTYWQNGCNVWSPNVGSLNDTLSSVLNEAP